MAEPAKSDPQPPAEHDEESARSRSFTGLGIALIILAGAIAVVWGGITLWSLWFR